jgi:hypothetical protein
MDSAVFSSEKFPGDNGMAGFGTLGGKADFVPNRGHVFR